MSEAKREMTKKGLATRKSWEPRFKSRELWSSKAKGSRERRLNEYEGGGKRRAGVLNSSRRAIAGWWTREGGSLYGGDGC